MEHHKGLSLKGRRLSFVLPDDSLWFKRLWLQDSLQTAFDKNSASASAGQQMSTTHLIQKGTMWDTIIPCHSHSVVKKLKRGPDITAGSLTRLFHLWILFFINSCLLLGKSPLIPTHHARQGLLQLSSKTIQLLQWTRKADTHTGVVEVHSCPFRAHLSVLRYCEMCRH